MSRRTLSLTLSALALTAAVVGGTGLLSAGSAAAHGVTSTVYVEVTAPAPDRVRTVLDLEYDLLVVSAAENEDDADLFEDGMDVSVAGDQVRALEAHAATVLRYVTERFTVTAGGEPCEPTAAGGPEVHERDGVPYATFVLDHACPVLDEPTHEVRSELFPDAEGYVRGVTAVVTYDLDGRTGSAALDARDPAFSTGQRWDERFGEFFLLGAEHLLTGPDHILFLLALVVGSRRLRDVVLAATAFTLAHSVTFLLAALGVVHAPAAVVEPAIAASIAVVAAWPLWGRWRRRGTAGVPVADDEPGPVGRPGPDRSGALRLAVVFCFGLVHGLGFAGALGIDEPWSWTLLWSLLVFNVGIEVVQLAIIAVAFPLLVLLRRRAPRTARWAGGLVAAGVAVTGLVWFVQRALGLG